MNIFEGHRYPKLKTSLKVYIVDVDTVCQLVTFACCGGSDESREINTDFLRLSFKDPSESGHDTTGLPSG